jgi:HAD superfamily hydrolase (TIGR01509 family)
MSNLYLFDCFGVVVSDVSTLWMNKHLNAEQQSYLRKVVYRQVDCGKMNFYDSFDIIAEMCGMTKQDVLDEWNSCAYPMIETLSLMQQLHEKGGTIALLSNASVEYIDFLFSQFDLYKYFDKLFISAQFRCAKPDREFYEKVLSSLDKTFDNIYFVDDNPQNLIEPAAMGVKTVLYKNAEQVKKDLGL